MLTDLGLDPALNFALGDPVQHGRIGGGGLGPEVAVLGGEIAEVFCDRLHRIEGIIEAFQRATEGSVGYS